MSFAQVMHLIAALRNYPVLYFQINRVTPIQVLQYSTACMYENSRGTQTHMRQRYFRTHLHRLHRIECPEALQIFPGVLVVPSSRLSVDPCVWLCASPPSFSRGDSYMYRVHFTAIILYESTACILHPLPGCISCMVVLHLA